MFIAQEYDIKLKTGTKTQGVRKLVWWYKNFLVKCLNKSSSSRVQCWFSIMRRMLGTFALESLEYIKHENVELFLTAVQHLNDCYDKEFAKLQKFAECCLKNILSLLQSSSTNTNLVYLLWSSLNLVLVSPITQKYIWRDKTVLVSLKSALLLANQTNNSKLIKATTNFFLPLLVLQIHSLKKFLNSELL